MILLDTHVLVWLVGEPERLSAAALDAIEAESEPAIALVSAQEIAYLVVRGRLEMDRPVDSWVRDVLTVRGVQAIPPPFPPPCVPARWIPSSSTATRSTG